MAKVNVDTQHPQYAVYADEWQTIRDCVDGERAVKSKGERYLPHPAAKPEKDADRKRYRNYALRAAFVNATGRTLNAMLGIAFNKPVKVELSGALAPFAEDMDGNGMPATQMLRGALAEVLQTGRLGFLVDTLNGVTFNPETGAVETSTVAKEAGNRPVIRMFKANEIINWRKDSLLVLKYTEEWESDDPDDFAVYPITVWIELRMVNGAAFSRKWYYNSASQQIRLSQGLPSGWSKTELTPIVIKGKAATAIPFAWCGSVDNDYKVDPAPLADIANLNVKHFNAEADVAEIAHIVGQPTLVVTGLTSAWVKDHLREGIGLGATKGLKLPTESDAKLLQAEERNLPVSLCERREKQMAMLGAALIERGTAPKTATEAEFDAQTDNSILALCASNIEKALNKALEQAAELVGGSGSVTLNKFYSQVVVDSQALTALMAGVQNGTIRLGDLIKWLMGQGIVDDSQTIEQVEEELRNQNPLPQMTPPDPVAPGDDEKDPNKPTDEEDA